jgi:hypothetical protein
VQGEAFRHRRRRDGDFEPLGVRDLVLAGRQWSHDENPGVGEGCTKRCPFLRGDDAKDGRTSVERRTRAIDRSMTIRIRLDDCPELSRGGGFAHAGDIAAQGTEIDRDL